MKKIILLFIISLFLYLFINKIFLLYKQSSIKEGMELIWKNSGNLKSVKENVKKMKHKINMINQSITNNIQRIKNNSDTLDRKNNEKDEKLQKASSRMDNISA
mgnify:FL=1